MKYWIGCSGFSYKEWKGIFYPKNIPQRKWFEYYCESFNTVELNVTFYRFPVISDLKGWYSRSPVDFRFAVKAPRIITHYKRFKNAAEETQRFYETVGEGLDNKLGSLLFQLHPAFQYSEANLELILTTLNSAFTNVLEFRHASWWRNDVLQALKHHQVCFCGISYPGLPEDVYHTSPVIYYRFHGIPKLYYSPYDDASLNHIYKTINAFQNVRDVYIYFNNTAESHAVVNAKTFQTILPESEQWKVKKPKGLFD
jgi:uncharacterized protein YecE (DUF72 family)